MILKQRATKVRCQKGLVLVRHFTLGYITQRKKRCGLAIPSWRETQEVRRSINNVLSMSTDHIRRHFKHAR